MQYSVSFMHASIRGVAQLLSRLSVAAWLLGLGPGLACLLVAWVHTRLEGVCFFGTTAWLDTATGSGWMLNFRAALFFCLTQSTRAPGSSDEYLLGIDELSSGSGAGPEPTPPPTPAPPLANECDLATCTCGGVALTQLKSRGVITTDVSTDGYSYMLSFCTEIPDDLLPKGCQNHVTDRPAVLKFKPDKPAECEEIGALGPCNDEYSPCGMSGVKTDSGVDVTFNYYYGCDYSYTVSLTHGAAEAKPGRKPVFLCGARP